MFDGGMQAMEFYLAALGFTVGRDGWRFEARSRRSPCRVRCRREVSPASVTIGYEIFVSGLSSDPYPTLYADILGTVDGVPAFHARRAVVRLVPDWPLDHWAPAWIAPCPAHRGGPPLPFPRARRGFVGLDGTRDDGEAHEAAAQVDGVSSRTTRPCWRAPGDGQPRPSVPLTRASTGRACCRGCPVRPITS